MIFFGLFHGLIFLPVLLSLFGPISYKDLTNCRGLGESNTNKEELQDSSAIEAANLQVIDPLLNQEKTARNSCKQQNAELKTLA